jgi:hypothetical protein
MSEARDAAVQEPRIDLLRRFVSEPELFHLTQSESIRGASRNFFAAFGKTVGLLGRKYDMIDYGRSLGTKVRILLETSTFVGNERDFRQSRAISNSMGQA